MPIATYIIVGITVLVSFYAFKDQTIFHHYRHYPYAEKRNKEYLRFLTSGFLHGSQTHLLVNMYMLYMFGSIGERIYQQFFGSTMGSLLFALMYLTCIIAADLPTFLKHRDNPNFASIGASGAVSGAIFLYIFTFPWDTLLLFFIIPVPAIILGIGYLIYSSWASKNTKDMIDHDAHFYGAIYGIIFTLIVHPSSWNRFIFVLINEFPLLN